MLSTWREHLATSLGPAPDRTPRRNSCYVNKHTMACYSSRDAWNIDSRVPCPSTVLSMHEKTLLQLAFWAELFIALFSTYNNIKLCRSEASSVKYRPSVYVLHLLTKLHCDEFSRSTSCLPIDGRSNRVFGRYLSLSVRDWWDFCVDLNNMGEWGVCMLELKSYF